MPPAPTPIDWASGGDCLGQLRLLRRAARGDRLKRGHEPPFAVVSSMPRTSLDWVDAPQVPIVADLPLETFDTMPSAGVAAPCILEVRPAADLRSAHRVIGLEEVVSAYQSSTKSEKNPDYEAAEARVKAAKGEGKKRAGVLKVGDPLLDLVGTLVGSVIETFGQVSSARDLSRAMAELKSTPRSIDRPVYRSYSFERALVRAGKEATIPVALHDRARGRIWRAELRQREMRELAVLDGLDARDRDYDQHRAGSMSWAEFEHWEQQPPQLPLSALVDALVDPGAGPESPAVAGSDAAAGDEAPDAGTADARPEPARQRRASPGRTGKGGGGDPRIESVVRIEAGGRRGAGFYVEPDVVATIDDVVGTESVPEVTTRGGSALGLVFHRDPIRNIALIHVPRPGMPGPLYDGGAIAPEQPVEILALGGGKRGRRLNAVLHGTHLVVDGGAAAPKGAPVFLDGQVIALVAATGREGRHTLVRVDQLYDVLDPAALAALP